MALSCWAVNESVRKDRQNLAVHVLCTTYCVVVPRRPCYVETGLSYEEDRDQQQGYFGCVEILCTKALLYHSFVIE